MHKSSNFCCPYSQSQRERERKRARETKAVSGTTGSCVRYESSSCGWEVPDFQFLITMYILSGRVICFNLCSLFFMWIYIVLVYMLESALFYASCFHQAPIWLGVWGCALVSTSLLQYIAWVLVNSFYYVFLFVCQRSGKALKGDTEAFVALMSVLYETVLLEKL